MARGENRINWQSNLEAAPDGILMGLRDKLGDMAKPYRVFFQVVTPDGREYTIYRQVPARHDEFVEVVFPRDFNAPQVALLQGFYVCTYVVNMAPTIQEKFTYTTTGGQARIDKRQTWFAGSHQR
jgi:hypothetical protein